MKDEWQKTAGNTLRAEIVRRGVSYEQLQEKLAQIGVEETAGHIAVKISRGTFRYTFFLQVMKALGVKTCTIQIDED
jgi:hypothetical protein